MIMGKMPMPRFSVYLSGESLIFRRTKAEDWGVFGVSLSGEAGGSQAQIAENAGGRSVLSCEAGQLKPEKPERRRK